MKLSHWIIYVAGATAGAGGVLTAYTNNPAWLAGGIVFSLASAFIVIFNEDT